jgi:alkanesulfonate monooxygenase SsuD/methylene tetrahydromethanopterin reductase-like flavin-dependent oxidoreductase (luciferase family)
MFGLALRQHDKRYDHAAEWIQIFDKCLGDGFDEFDFEGEYVGGRNIYNHPKSVQQPRPAVMSAAFSEAGRDFAVRHADILLTAGMAIDNIPDELADLDRRASLVGRSRPDVLTVTTIVCRPNRKEAQVYNDHYSRTMADQVVIGEYLERRRQGAAMMDVGTLEKEAQYHAGGANVAGTPDDVVDYLLALKKGGYAGTAIQFVNFLDDLPYFVSEVIPRMEQAGLRLPVNQDIFATGQGKGMAA